MDVRQLDISEVAKQSGLSASTLRYYEERGLISSIGRNGLRRVFAADILQRLALIALARKAGFSLGEINSMLARDGATIDRQQLELKADQVDRTIKQLTVMRDGLRHAAKCSAPNHLECPTFQRLLRFALKDLRRRKTVRRRSAPDSSSRSVN